MVRSVFEPALRLAESQDQIVSRGQLRALGLTRFDVRTQVRAGRWIKPSPHTVATVTGTLTSRQQWRVAVLETGCADAALDGVTALQAAGLLGVSGPTEVSCRHGSRPRPVPGVRVRVTRWRSDTDVISAGVPRVRPAPATIHAALWARSHREAALVAVAAVQQRLTTPTRLQAELDRIQRHPRRSILRQVIDDLAGGAQALGELDFTRMCRVRGLPRPRQQAVRTGSGGRCYLDVSFDDYGVAVEIDGAQHRWGLAPVADALRQNALVVAGEVVLRIPLVGLRVDPAPFLDQVEAALVARGWRRTAGP